MSVSGMGRRLYRNGDTSLGRFADISKHGPQLSVLGEPANRTVRCAREWSTRFRRVDLIVLVAKIRNSYHA